MDRSRTAVAPRRTLRPCRHERQRSRAHASARSASRPCRRGRTSRSSPSCCARPAWRSSASWSSAASSRTRTPTSAPARSPRRSVAAQACDANLIACDDELTRPPGAQPRGGARPARRRPHDGDPRHLRLPRGQRRGQAAGRARPARVQPRAHARPVEPPRAAGRRHRHAGARARPRSRPIAAWRATASRRCAGASST